MFLTRQRLEEGVPVAPVTSQGYCNIHHFIFQDLYDWAGKYRTANMRHPAHDAFFCRTEFLAQQMDAVFRTLSALPVANLTTTEAFASALAGPIGDLNAIHPFREGNGRTMRAFLEQFAARCHLRFDQTRLDPAQWNEASRLNFIDADPGHFRSLLMQALV